MPKLTLNLDTETINKAKRIADQRGISVSAMFMQFVEAMGHSLKHRKPAPTTRQLRGIAKADSNKTDRQLFEDAIVSSMD